MGRMAFTDDAFFAVFAGWNAAIWPLQILAYGAGLAVLGSLARPSREADRAIFGILAAMWAVNGIGYHLVHFTPINPVARFFAALFLLQAVLLAAAPWLWLDRRLFVPVPGLATGIGLALIGFAFAVYPALGYLAGHRWPAVPVFGVAPCPTTIFTIGVLLLGDWKVARWLLIVPVLWSVIGGSAAVLLGVPQDYGLIAAGLAAAVLALGRGRGAPS